jgi:hypothetical protein
VSSLKDRVQQRSRQLRVEQAETFDVPGYEGILRARYRALGLKEIDQIAERVGRIKEIDDTTRKLYVYADHLVRACEAVYDAELDKTHRKGDPPPEGQRWSAQLAHDLGFDGPETPRQAVLAIIARDTQVYTHYLTVMAWMDGSNQQADEDLLGESEPPPLSS